MAATATILAVAGITAFLEFRRIDGALEALSTPSGGGTGIATASVAPLASGTLRPLPPVQPAVPRPSPAAMPPESLAQAAPTPATSAPSEAARNGAAVPAPSLPARQTTRVVVRYHRGDAIAKRHAALIAEELRQTGLRVEEPRPAPRWVGHARLQYFFEADRDAAAAIAAYLGPRFGQETPGRPDPSDPAIQPGTVEIWVPGARPPPRRRSFSDSVADLFR